MIGHLTAKPGSSKGYSPNECIFPLVLMMIGGGEALVHTRQLSNDRCLSKLLNRPKIPDSGTTGDWLVRVYPQGYEGLEYRHLKHKILNRDPHKVYTLDADATGIESLKAWDKSQGVLGARV